MTRFTCGCRHKAECPAPLHRGREQCEAIGEIGGNAGLPEGWKAIGGAGEPVAVGHSMCGPCADADPTGGFEVVLDAAGSPLDVRSREFFLAYIRMEAEAKIRMEAPSDGLGNIQLSDEQMRDRQLLNDEALRYAARMVKYDDDTKYKLFGCVDLTWAKAFAFTFEAARLMFSGHMAKKNIVRLLEMALNEIRGN